MGFSCLSLFRSSPRPSSPAPSRGSPDVKAAAQSPRSVVSPPPYTPSASSAASPASTIEGSIAAESVALRVLSLEIHSHPELAWKEFHAHDVLCSFLEQRGFEVTRSAYGFPTAWKAEFRHKWVDNVGLRTVGFCSEMDALPGIGHACGHNLIAMGGAAAVLALASSLQKHDQPGRIILLGTPAEESDGGKLNLLRARAFSGMDICLMLHPAPEDGLGGSLAISEVEVVYEGVNAHAAQAPWEGVNALDAAVLAYSNVSALRQQVEPSHRIHGVLKGSEEWVCNIIPAKASLIYGIRARTNGEVEALKPRMENCFKAAAIATGCTVTIKWIMAYKDTRINSALGNGYRSYMEEEQGIKIPDLDPPASGDFGDVSYVVPGICPSVRIPTNGPGTANHTPAFTASAATMEAHEATIRAAKGLAVTGWRFFVDDAFAKEVRDEFAKWEGK